MRVLSRVAPVIGLEPVPEATRWENDMTRHLGLTVSVVLIVGTVSLIARITVVAKTPPSPRISWSRSDVHRSRPLRGRCSRSIPTTSLFK